MQRNAGKIWRARNGGRSEFARRKSAEISPTVFGCRAPAIVGRGARSTIAPRRGNSAGGDQLRFAALARNVATVRQWKSATDLCRFGGGTGPPTAAGGGTASRAPTKTAQLHQRAIFFDGATSELPPAPWDVAFHIHTNVYEGETRIDLHVKALRSAASLD